MSGLKKILTLVLLSTLASWNPPIWVHIVLNNLIFLIEAVLELFSGRGRRDGFRFAGQRNVQKTSGKKKDLAPNLFWYSMKIILYFILFLFKLSSSCICFAWIPSFPNVCVRKSNLHSPCTSKLGLWIFCNQTHSPLCLAPEDPQHSLGVLGTGEWKLLVLLTTLGNEGFLQRT